MRTLICSVVKVLSLSGCDFIVADSNTVSECLVVTVPCGFVTVGG